jgi:hypothetical protein
MKSPMAHLTVVWRFSETEQGNMSIISYSFYLLTMIVVLVGCESATKPLDSHPLGSLEISASSSKYALESPAKAVVVTARILVTGEEMTAIERSVTVVAGQVRAEVSNIPVGLRKVELSLLTETSTELWHGAVEVEILPNRIAEANIDLLPVGNTRPQIVEVQTRNNQVRTSTELQAIVEDVHDDLDHIEFRWDFDADGRYDTDWVRTNIGHYEYSVPGLYGATVQAKDRFGLTSTKNLSISINPEIRTFSLGNAVDGSVYVERFITDQALGDWVLEGGQVSGGVLLVSTVNELIRIIAPTDFGSSLVIVTDFSIQGSSDTLTGVVFGIDDTQSVQYLAVIDATGSFSLKRFNSETGLLDNITEWTPGHPLGPNKNRMVVSFNPDNFKVGLNGVLIEETSTFETTSGKIGLLLSGADAQMEIEHIRVFTPPFYTDDAFQAGLVE